MAAGPGRGREAFMWWCLQGQVWAKAHIFLPHPVFSWSLVKACADHEALVECNSTL